MSDRARVVLVGLDGFPNHVVGPRITPAMWRLSTEGGYAPAGGRCSLPSSTYPGFSSLLTGCVPRRHGVRTTNLRPGAVPGWAGHAQVQAPTLFEACRVRGLASAAILGDHLLHAVLRTDAADRRWPPAGTPPAGTALDAYGYALNEEVLPRALEAIGDPSLDLVFVHLNEADTFGHELGPSHPDTIECYRRTDEAIARLWEALQPDRSRTVLIVTSDHGMEDRGAPTRLRGCEGIRRLFGEVLEDGGCALLRPHADADPQEIEEVLGRVPGVNGWRSEEDGIVLLEAAPGYVFGEDGEIPPGGCHGGPSTAETVALVAGGHPAVAEIAASLRTSRPHLADWAPTIGGILDLELGSVDGRDLRAGCD
jgi:arylsulfatase A-like enzyme